MVKTTAPVKYTKKISLERRDQIKAVRQNKMLHYSMSAKVFQKLNITVMCWLQSPSAAGKEHIHAYPEFHQHSDIFITLRFQQILHFLHVLWTEDFTSTARSVTLSIKIFIMKTPHCSY